MSDQMITVQAKVTGAKYHPSEGYISVKVVTPDGKCRVLPIHASTMQYHGKPFKETPKDEGDKEMQKLEALLKEKAGKMSINVQMYDQQF